MKNSEELRQQLRSINRKSYPAYKGLKGLYHFGNYILSIDHVQGDPFASPSHVSIQISHRDAGFPVEYYKDTRGSGIYPSDAARKKSLRIHSRRLHPPKRKRYFLPPYESFRSLYFSGQSAHFHKSSP